VHVHVGNGLERNPDESSIVLELRGGGDQDERLLDLGEPVRGLARPLPVARTDHDGIVWAFVAVVLERL
jgi:hypothetical protein